MNNQKITFWQFLSNHIIEIPIIQRDYAQGRKGKCELRYNFLTQLYESLLSEKETKLDFVYGSIENGIFFPLDGQQRLTTLWLIHLYIAFKANKLASVKEIFLHFTYETRTSSSEFCKYIVNSLSNCSDQIICLSDYIRNQTWYYLHYDQDPTIQAMLRMISGDKDETLPNGIEQIFKIDQKTAEHFWNLLVNPNILNCPIKFYFRGMQDENMPLCDDLYIKMNARGKQLTHFENFKAELLGAKVYSGKQLFNIDKCQKDQEFISLIDNQWTDLFWTFKHPKLYRVDEIMFKFINRFLLNYLICHSRKKDLQKDTLFRKLYGYPDSKNPKVFHAPQNEFGSMDIYAPTIKYGMKKKLQYLFTGLMKLNSFANKNGKNVNDFFKEEFSYYFKHSKDSFSFIPEYINLNDTSQSDNQPVSNISQLDRVLFHAICCYLIQFGRRSKMAINRDNFLDWIRVIYNVSVDVNTVEGMISYIRLVDELSPHCRNIKKALANKRLTISSKVAPEQIKEEREKAKLEMNGNGKRYRKLFIKAEQFPFFNGSIRAIIRDEMGNYCDDYLMSAKKAIFCLHYFDNNGVKGLSNAIRFLMTVISYCDKKDLWWDKKVFHNNRETWLKNIFNYENKSNPIYAKSVHNLLLGAHDNKDIDTSITVIYEPNLIRYILEKKRDFWWRNTCGGSLFICGTSSGILLNRQDRDKFIIDNMRKRQDFRNIDIIPGTELIWGFDVYFEYLNSEDEWIKFYWDRNKIIPPKSMTEFFTTLERTIFENKSLGLKEPFIYI